MTNNQKIALAVIGGIAAYALYKSQQPISADYTSPDYMLGDPEIPELYHSTDDFGGTVFYEQLPIAGIRLSRNRK